MALPTISGTARLTADPEIRFAASGMAVSKMNIAFNSRRKDQAGNWVDGDTFFVEAVAFKQLAENIAETLTRGMEVVVTGRLKTESWEDRETGAKRSKPSLMIDSIGPSIAFATAKVQKLDRSAGSGGNAAAGDPWSSSTSSTSGGGSAFDDTPPF